MCANGCQRAYITLQARAFRHAFAGGPPLQPLTFLDRRARGRRLARRVYTLCDANARGNRRARVSGGSRRARRIRADHRLDRRVQSYLRHLLRGGGKICRWEPALTEKIELLGKEPYDAGWLYAIEGKPDSRCTDVHGYVGLLDATIDKMLEKQEYSEDV